MSMKTKAWRAALLSGGLAVVALVAFADPESSASIPAGNTAAAAPTTRPATEEPRTGRPPMAPPMGGRFGPVEMRIRRGAFQPTPDQIKEMEAFVSAHSPNRFRAYQNMGNQFPMFRDRLQGSLVRANLDLQALHEDDPEVYKIKIQQIELQDKIFGLVADARERRQAENGQVRAELRPLEAELVGLRRQEAELRVQRLSDALNREKELVANLSAKGSGEIDAMVEEDLTNGGRLGPGPGGFGGRGFRGGPGGGGGGGGPTTEPSMRER